MFAAGTQIRPHPDAFEAGFMQDDRARALVIVEALIGPNFSDAAVLFTAAPVPSIRPDAPSPPLDFESSPSRLNLAS